MPLARAVRKAAGPLPGGACRRRSRLEKKPVKGKTLKGKLITAVTALSLFTGITAGSVFDSPSEITLSDVKEPTPVVEVVDLGKKDASMEIQTPDAELIEEEKLSPFLVIGVPVGFVNVVQSKEQIMKTAVPYIVAKGRKGGSNIAACICNALLYMLEDE